MSLNETLGAFQVVIDSAIAAIPQEKAATHPDLYRLIKVKSWLNQATSTGSGSGGTTNVTSDDGKNFQLVKYKSPATSTTEQFGYLLVDPTTDDLILKDNNGNTVTDYALSENTSDDSQVLADILTKLTETDTAVDNAVVDLAALEVVQNAINAALGEQADLDTDSSVIGLLKALLADLTSGVGNTLSTSSDSDVIGLLKALNEKSQTDISIGETFSFDTTLIEDTSSIILPSSNEDRTLTQIDFVIEKAGLVNIFIGNTKLMNVRNVSTLDKTFAPYIPVPADDDITVIISESGASSKFTGNLTLKGSIQQGLD